MQRAFITAGKKPAQLWCFIWLVSISITVSTGCTARKIPQKDSEKFSSVKTTNSKTIKTLTSFTESLRCVDHLLDHYNHPEILIDVEVSEEGSQSVVGVKDMVMTSLSNMSTISGAIKVVAKSPAQDLYYEYSEKQQFKAPDYFIRLSSPQIERAQTSNSAAFDVRVPIISTNLGASTALRSSVISLDMNMGSHHNLQLIPGVNSRNSIVLVSSSEKVDVSVGNTNTDEGLTNLDNEGQFTNDESVTDNILNDEELSQYENYDDQPSIGSLTKFGTTFKLNFGYRDGKHVAIRTLIELGVIELIGKYTKVPYRDCLDDPSGRAKPVVKKQPAQDLTVSVTPTNKKVSGYKSGDLVEVYVSVGKDAFVYCYYEDYGNSIRQILPNPYQPSNSVNPAEGMLLPGSDKFQINIDSGKGYDQIFCVAHESPVKDKLPSGLVASNLKKLPYKSLDELLQQHRLADTKLAVSNVFSFRGR